MVSVRVMVNARARVRVRVRVMFYSCQDSCMDRERGEVWAAGHLAPG